MSDEGELVLGALEIFFVDSVHQLDLEHVKVVFLLRRGKCIVKPFRKGQAF